MTEGFEPLVVRFKDGDGYLSNPVWVGNGVPGWYMGVPWGLGGECWMVQARVPSEMSPGWSVRKAFAGMVRDEVVTVARAWLDAGAPRLSGRAEVPASPVVMAPVPLPEPGPVMA